MVTGERVYSVISANRFKWRPGMFKIDWNISQPQEHKILQVNERNLQVTKMGHVEKHLVNSQCLEETDPTNIPPTHNFVLFTDYLVAELYMIHSEWVSPFPLK